MAGDTERICRSVVGGGKALLYLLKVELLITIQATE
jgi:hypothetical protein